MSKAREMADGDERVVPTGSEPTEIAETVEPAPSGHVCASSTEFGAAAAGASSTGGR